MTDNFARELGVTVTNHKPIYVRTVAEVLAHQRPLAKNRPICGIQPMASIANRNYPFNNWARVMDGLITNGWEIWLFGAKGQLPRLQTSMKHVRDISLESDSFRESVSYLSACDVFVGIDSSLLHVCQAIDIPAFGLYGPFPSENRIKDSANVVGIDGKGKCAPCNWHMHAGQQFPPWGPCAKTGYCTVLASITPAHIISQVNRHKPSNERSSS